MTRDDLVTMLGDVAPDLKMGDVVVCEDVGRLAVVIRRSQDEVDRIRDAVLPHTPAWLAVDFLSTVSMR